MEWAKAILLPELRAAQRRCGGPVRCGLIGELVGLSRRQAYHYLALLREAGKVELMGRRWMVSGYSES